MSKKISKEQLAYAKSLVESGVLLKHAAEAIDYSPDVLGKHLRALGVDTRANSRKRKPGNWLKLDTAEILRRYQAGESVLALAAAYKVSRGVIWNRLKEGDVHVRTSSEANIVRMQRMTFSERRSLSAAARAAHIKSIQSNSVHYSRGPGETEIGKALAELGHPVEYQFPLDGGCIDFAIGSVAVEVKMNSGGCYMFDGERIEQIRNANMTPLFIGFNHMDCISERLEEIVALADFACRHPAPLGEHWVVRCRRYTRTGSANIYDTTIERRTDNSSDISV